MSSEDPPSSDLSTLSSLLFSISLPLLSAESHKDLLYKAINEEKIRNLLKGFMLDSQTKRIIITKVVFIFSKNIKVITLHSFNFLNLFFCFNLSLIFLFLMNALFFPLFSFFNTKNNLKPNFKLYAFYE